MKESADESDLECLRSPETGEFLPVVAGSVDLTKNDFATVQDANYLISRCSVRLDLKQF